MANAFDIMFQSAKDEIWFEHPSEDRVIEIVGEVIRTIETDEQKRRLKEFFDFSEARSYKQAVLKVYSHELSETEEESQAVR